MVAGDNEAGHATPWLVGRFYDALVDFCAAQNGHPRNRRMWGLHRPTDSDLANRSPPPAELPAASRVVALGDVHGDIEKTRKSLEIAGLIDEHDNWIGGNTTVVQVGDQMDRGDDELQILLLFEELKVKARQAGGAFHVLNGNHETMTVHGDYRYCNDAAFTQFNEWSWWYRLGHRMKRRCGIPSQPIPVPDPADESSGRTIAFAPGAPLARRFFADQQAVLKLGGSVFVHGGLLLEHLPVGLAELNRISQGWISGRDAGASIPSFLRGRRALVWSRRFSRVDETECRCDELEQVLEKLDAKRMVVGHTIQHPHGINSACNGKVFRVDVGMSKGCEDALPEVLEIVDDQSFSRIRARAEASSTQAATASAK